MKNKTLKKVKGFTIQEVLIAVVVIGILSTIFMVNRTKSIAKVKSEEAKLQLREAYALQKNYFYINSKYGTSLNEIDYEQQKLVSEGGPANYKIEMGEVSTNGFTIKATSITDFNGDGAFNVWEINTNGELNEVVKD